MATWSVNNRACTTLYTTFISMQQLFGNFSSSGELKMSDLTFFNNLGSSELRRQQANIIADQLDHIFRIGRGAEYEADVLRTDAMNAMITVLTNGDLLLQDLAEKIDECYLFWGERKF